MSILVKSPDTSPINLFAFGLLKRRLHLDSKWGLENFEKGVGLDITAESRQCVPGLKKAISSGKPDVCGTYWTDPDNLMSKTVVVVRVEKSGKIE